MKNILFADDIVLVQSDSNLGNYKARLIVK